MNVEGVSEILDYLQATGTLGLLWVVGKLYVDRRRLQVDAASRQQQSDLDLEKHRDGLTFQLLEAARVEVAALRQEVTRLRPGEDHLLHFEGALGHIEALLAATTQKERRAAERAAQAFLNRMRRRADALGTIANEVQRSESSLGLIERGVFRGKDG